MLTQKYFEDEIELTQEVVQEVIILLQNPQTLLEEISEFELNSFEDVISSIQVVIYLKLSKKKDKIVNETTFSQGLTTAIIFYNALFFISKGLERQYKYTLNKKLFELIPYSMQENIGINQSILGIQKIKRRFRKDYYFSISTTIPLVTSSMFIFGGDKTRKVGCPYTQNNEGKILNKELSSSLLNFLNLIYLKILRNLLEDYSNISEDRTPDYINVLLGRFELNQIHIEKYPQFFQKLY